MKSKYMARVARIGLDMALVSIRTIRPAIEKVWTGSKNYIVETSAKRLVNNAFVKKTENVLQRATEFLEAKLTTLRDRQLPKEIEYLEKELQNIKEKIKRDEKTTTSKAFKPAAGRAWQYAKIEMVPPFTTNFFNGATERKLEEYVSNTANSLIGTLQKTVREMDAEKERLLRQKEEAITNLQEKLKAKMKKAKDEVLLQATKIKAQKIVEPKKEKTKDISPEVKSKNKPKTDAKKDF